MILMDIVMDGFLAAVAGIGFGAISHPPRRAFVYIAVLAATGHAMRFVLMNYLSVDIAIASFCAALCIGVMALGFGKQSYCPMTVLYIPALLPMIPGMYAYNTIFATVMFMQHLQDPLLAGQYMQEIFSNALITLSTVFLLSVGATTLIFIFPGMTYSLTRRRKFDKNCKNI
jgi:uncharacterized membrane protein YjjB (DUF3815 family)